MTSEGQLIHSEQTTILDTPPSCIAFSPFNTNHVLVGTYLLESGGHGDLVREGADGQATGKKSQSRSGSLLLFIVDGNQISLFQTVKTSYAVLDLRFSILRPGMIAVAASTGVIDLFGFDIFDTGPITHVQTIQLADSSTLVLSLAWSPSELFSSTLAASLSNGRIVTLDYESPQSLKYLGTSHSLEAWTLAWSANAPEPLHLYSGGDDSTICEHSLQSKQNDLKISIDKSDSMFHDSKIHMAGVTAILSLNGGCGEDPEILLTGSYDEHIRVLTPGTSSSNRRFQVLAEKRLDGGVWRLNSLAMSFKENSLSFTILASCMHSGAKILKVQYRKGKEWTIEVLARFEEHESMNYASDAWLDPHASTLKFTVVSTSFYDRKLCVWKYEEP